jgi:hypothetical protein
LLLLQGDAWYVTSSGARRMPSRSFESLSVGYEKKGPPAAASVSEIFT